MWMGGSGYSLAGALVELIHQLQAAYPSQVWQTSPQTGTVGDLAHQAEGSGSDHNPWLNGTVRALDVDAGDPNGPDCEALFQMVNRMYAAHDSRVWPNGYAIYRARITDWDNPGAYHPYSGSDLHYGHVHISVSQTPAGYNSPVPWPLTGTVGKDWFDMATEADLTRVLRYELPRIAGVLRYGTGNAAYNVGNSGAALVDGKGLKGDAIAAAATIETGPIDVDVLAEKIVAGIVAALAKGTA